MFLFWKKKLKTSINKSTMQNKMFLLSYVLCILFLGTHCQGSYQFSSIHSIYTSFHLSPFAQSLSTSVENSFLEERLNTRLCPHAIFVFPQNWAVVSNKLNCKWERFFQKHFLRIRLIWRPLTIEQNQHGN